MFTGLVEEVGQVDVAEPMGEARRIGIRASKVLDRLQQGDSIAIDGVCLTVVAIAQDGFQVDAIATTLERTTAAEWTPGRPVNLERALALGDRMGGHVVQGHVDAVGTVLAVRPGQEHVLVDLSLPEIVAEVTVLHGSIAVDGVSLTVNAVTGTGHAQVALIPHTWQHTNLRRLAAGDRVNLEGDLLGRFVVNYLKQRGGV